MTFFRFYLPFEKAEDAYLLCCQGFAVVHYGLRLGEPTPWRASPLDASNLSTLGFRSIEVI